MVFTSSFNLWEYKEKNTKEKVFIDYVYMIWGLPYKSKNFNNEYFTLFTVDDLIQSMEYYIDKYSITAKITAQNYVTYVTNFFRTLSEEHGINNEIFTDINLLEQLQSKAKEIYSKLKESESKNIASDDQYELLSRGIDEFLDVLDINDIYNEIDQSRNGLRKYAKIYHRFISIIPIKLIMKFGLSNLAVISLERKDLDMDRGTITVNGFELRLDDELVQVMTTYLRIREYVLQQYSLQENKLFIKYNGKPYIIATTNRANQPDYSSFFMIMKDKIGTQSADLLQSRRILDMLSKGVDISVIAKLSDRSTEKCVELQRTSNTQEDAIKKLQIFLQGDKDINKKIAPKKKGFLTCPSCGHETKAISDEWILVQYEENGPKFLACRECKGSNGKFTV